MSSAKIKKSIIILLIILPAIYLCLRLSVTSRGNQNSPVGVSDSLSDSGSSSGFEKAVNIRKFKFPEDHGPHKNFQTEWWYFTGNLKDENNKLYGYQLTFFRRGLSRYTRTESDSSWRTGQIYFAHFALTDVEKKQYDSYEKWSREMDQLAGSKSLPLDIWIDNWTLNLESGNFMLKANSGNISIDLTLTPLKDVVLQGDKGLSRKSPEKGNASYYYSITRLATSGIIKSGNSSYKVKGDSWFDHEWSTSALNSNQEGWDWFSIQLDNGMDIMIYMLRLKNGKTDPVSSGTIVGNDGESVNMDFPDFRVRSTGTWFSKNTEIRYPSGWEINIPEHGIDLLLRPLLDDQEFRNSFNYWEGAVSVKGKDGINGVGYVELTGYK